MNTDSKQIQMEGKQVVSFYLSAVLLMAYFATTSPWLHVMFEHLSFDRDVKHAHIANGRVPHSHPATHHTHPEGDSSNGQTGEHNHSADHEHHGLSALFAGGLLEISDGSVVLSLPSEQAVTYRFFTPDARYRRAFDFIQAQRPPPASV